MYLDPLDMIVGDKLYCGVGSMLMRLYRAIISLCACIELQEFFALQLLFTHSLFCLYLKAFTARQRALATER